METLVESPRAAFVSGSSLPAFSPFSLSRLILPVLCVSLGVSVGTATGITLALVNASRNTVAASSDSLQASAAPESSVAMNSSSAQAAQSTVVSSPIAASSAPAANPDSNPVATRPQAKLNPASETVARTGTAPSKVEIALNKAPDALKPATFRLNGKEYRAVRMIFLPAAKPEQSEPATAQPAAPTALSTAQWGLDTPAPASLYTEGVLTVSDYSESTRTIQTSDGRTFVLGTTVAAGNATPWETYRSDVHYRCDQNGSCVLMRAGVVAPDARLI
jgi:hypothetical protein